MDETYSTFIKKYLFDIAKIVEGATNADHAKVAAYSKQLAEKLQSDGETEGAKRIQQILDRSKVQKLGFARADSKFFTVQPTLPVDGESRLSLADEERFDRNQVEIFLPDDVKKKVSQFLAFHRAADRLMASGVGMSSSMLLYGPPGCGKTHLARFIAAELELPLITARTDALISSYLGSTAKNVRLLFEHAASRPCVLFLDEFDALAKMRDDSKELGELKRVVISLLQNIDALGKEHILFAATNHEHLLDPAIWRRFSYTVKLTEPEEATRVQMVKKFFGKFADENVPEVIATVTAGMSGAQLRDATENAIREAILLNKERLRAIEVLPLFLTANPKLRISDPSSVAEQVRLLRKLDKEKFTQVRLAEIFDLSQPQISKLLKGGNYAE